MNIHAEILIERLRAQDAAAPEAALGFRRSLLVRDPDGHALQVAGD